MSHSLVYIVPFKSLRNDAFEVHILKENHVGGSPIELVGGGDPLTISFDDEDFLYTPCRQSSCKIKVVGSDYLQDLYSNNYHEWKVNIYRNKTLIWTGFINPETYTQDFTNTTIELQLEAKSALSVLENIEYKKGETGFITMWGLLHKIIQASKADWNYVYIPEVYGINKDSVVNSNILEHLELSETNFFDEEDKAMMYLEVIEELCKILNWNVTDWNGSLVFTDIDHKGTYRRYTKSLVGYDKITPKIYNVQDIGFQGGDQNLDRLGGYNKVTVEIDNYRAGELFPDEDIDDLKTIGAIEFNYRNSITRRVHKAGAKYLIPYHFTKLGKAITKEQYAKLSDADRDNSLGAIICQDCIYKIVDGEPDITNYKYESVIYLADKWVEDVPDASKFVYIKKWTPMLRIETGQNILYYGGYLVLNFQTLAKDPYRQYIDQEFNTYHTIWAILQVGNMWWNGKDWQDTETRFPIGMDLQGKEYISNYASVKSTKKLGQEPEGADGYIIKLTKGLRGKATFTIVAGLDECRPGGLSQNTPSGVYLKNLSLKHFPEFKSEDDNGDRIYENVVNESYINAADDIRMKISTFNNDGLTHSKIIYKNELVTNNIYCTLAEGNIRFEELLIDRICNQYNSPKYKLTQQLKYTPDLSPFDFITDRFMPNILFTITGTEFEAAKDFLEIKMVENVN